MLTREEEIGLAYGAWVTSHPVGADHGDSFIAGAQWADKNPKNKWRDASVLPKDDDYVLADVVSRHGRVLLHAHEIVCYYHRIHAWYDIHYKPVNVARWQPLPELPKDDE
jgi:hypothetical protein